jgi:hypothetical protein
MTTVVLNSAQEIERLTTGKVTERAEITADNAKRAEAKTEKPEPAKDAKKEPAKEAPKVASKEDPDEVEDHDGLTPKEKRELTEKMQRAIAKRHREKMEAEKFAADQYNTARLAEQRAEAAEQERDAFKQELAKLRQPAQAEESGEPQREKFQTDKEYQDAMIDWRVDQKLKAKEVETAKKREEMIQQNVQSSLARAVELVPDFEEVTSAAEVMIPQHIVHLMQESGLFAELGYHFAQSPEDLAKLAIATPKNLKVEFQKIESKLTPFASRSAAGADGKSKSPADTESATPAAAKGNGAGPNSTESAASGAGPKQSRAPVIKPLNVNSASQVEKPAGEMTYQEAKADWEKRRGVSLERRRRH